MSCAGRRPFLRRSRREGGGRVLIQCQSSSMPVIACPHLHSPTWIGNVATVSHLSAGNFFSMRLVLVALSALTRQLAFSLLSEIGLVPLSLRVQDSPPVVVW